MWQQKCYNYSTDKSDKSGDDSGYYIKTSGCGGFAAYYLDAVETGFETRHEAGRVVELRVKAVKKFF